jgi:phosphate:Na+ symporter
MVVQAGSAAEKGDLSWFFLGVGLLGGLSLFLYGMDRMSDALKNVAGEKMKDILGMLSSNRIMGLITGAIVTAVIQSSSVTTVMLVGFVSAGLMSLSQTIGIVMGSNIGTTITAQVVA